MIPVVVRSSRIHGRGVYTTAAIVRRCKLGEVTGHLVPRRAALREQRQRAIIHLVELDDDWALDCTDGNEFRHLNHACTANCFLRVCARRVEVYSLGPIPAGRELTVNYRSTQHPGGMPCHCQAANCRRKL